MSYAGMCELNKGENSDFQKIIRAKMSPQQALCSRTEPDDDGAPRRVPNCPHYPGGSKPTCKFWEQVKEPPAVWGLASASLQYRSSLRFSHRNGLQVNPRATFIDESFWKGSMGNVELCFEHQIDGLPDHYSTSRDGALIRRSTSPNDLNRNETLRLWAQIRTLVNTDNLGPFSQRTIMATLGDNARLGDQTAYVAARLDVAIEYHRERSRRSIPSHTFGDKLDEAADICKSLSEHITRLEILREIKRTIVELKDRASGRLFIESRYCSLQRERCPAIAFYPFRSASSCWTAKAAVTVLDAYPPAARVQSSVLGRAVECGLDLRVEDAKNVSVTLVKNAPNRKYQLASTANGSLPQHFHDILNAVRIFTATRAHQGRVLWIPQKSMIDRIWPEKSRLSGVNRPIILPSNLDIETAGRIAGRNDWKNHHALIITANMNPGVDALEHQAGVLSGEYVSPIQRKTNGNVSIPLSKVGQPLKDGTFVAMDKPNHPNALVNELADQHIVGNLIQQIGRLRPIRRGDTPAEIVVLTDWALPRPVDAVVDWNDFNLERRGPLLLKGGFSTSQEDQLKISGTKQDIS
ncbi:MAG: hypothetical protein AAFY73_14975 [Pseudomonadota bacterium]